MVLSNNMYRSYSDIEGGRVRVHCNQLINRTPDVTKEMLQKLQNAKDERELCGYNLHLKETSILIALIFLFVMSLISGYVIFMTNIYDENVLHYSLIIKNDSINYKNFKRPVEELVKVYAYNYTNVREFEKGIDSKLKVEEVGPYVYRHQLERVNVRWSDDDTLVTYQDYNTYEFDEELSGGGRTKYDRITVPNIPMLSAAAMAKDMNFLQRLFVNGVFYNLNAHPFIELPVDRFLFGYDDNLFSLVKTVPGLTKPIPFERFGLLALRSGLSSSILQAHTGVDDLDLIGRLNSINSRTEYDHWATQQCNRVNAVDGILFSPHTIAQKRDVQITLRDLCRKMTLKYDQTHTIFDGAIEVYRYVLDNSTFDLPDVQPANQCYAPSPLRGLFNATDCTFGTPIFASMPHFYYGDEQLLDMVEGISPPVKELHESYMDVHPFMGFTTQGWSRLQSNIHVAAQPGLPKLAMFRNDTILPIAWLEVGLDAADLPDDPRQLIYNATYLVQAVRLCIQIGSMLIAVLTLAGLILMYRSGSLCRKTDQTHLLS